MATLKERREAIESLKIPGREKVAGRKEDAFRWLKEWQDQNGVGPGVKPLEQHIPMHYRPFILRRAEALPQRDGMKIAHGDGGGWEHLGPEAKRRLNDKEYQDDVIRQVLDGTLLPSDGAQILQMEENEFTKFMNDLKPNEGTSPTKSSILKDLLIKSR
jgi:hypothetical protein